MQTQVRTRTCLYTYNGMNGSNTIFVSTYVPVLKCYTLDTYYEDIFIARIVCTYVL